MLEVKNLTSSVLESGVKDGKLFKISDVSFSLEDGYIMALLGKNGSGKTTLMQLMYGNLLKKSGQVIWNGKEFNKKTRDSIRQDIALISGDSWCFDNRSIVENLEYLSLMFPAFDEKLFMDYLRRFDFPKSDMNKPIVKLSTGEKVQFEIAFAAARKPKLMILDEPFANLDPVVKVDIMEIIQELVNKENMSAIISTHLISEIDDVVDYVGVIDDGKLVKFGDRVSLVDDKNLTSISQLLASK